MAVQQDFYPSPRPTRSASVWAIAPFLAGADYGLTGIHHSDLDCPAIRDWRSITDHGGTRLIEIDLATATFWPWTLYENDKRGTWCRFGGDDRRVDLDEWRPCLRCGSASRESPTPCERCFLTICDCV